MTRTIAITLLVLAAGCPAPVCPTLATRCDGQVAQVCDADGQWQEVADCSTLWETSGGEWTCEPTTSDGVEVHACLPAGSR
jgi:hypothetical protein